MQRIAFIGPPNVGKSTLYGRLTGVFTPVSNWAGMTVDAKVARVLWCNKMLEVVDLPGIYSLSGGGEDEKLAQQLIEADHAELWVVVLDAMQLPRQLPLLHALLEKKLPVVCLINQIDMAQQTGVVIDVAKLQDLTGVPVLAVSARQAVGLEQAKSAICHALLQRPLPCGDHSVQTWLDAAYQAPVEAGHALTEKLDSVLLHPIWGIPIFVMIMIALFQGVFWLGGHVQDGLATIFDWVQVTWLVPSLSNAPAWLSGLIIDGLYNGIATLLSFVPLVAIFFFMISALSDSGYLARMAFLADGLMASLGLEGRSFVLTVMGMGCNVPAIMGARIIPDKRVRWITQLMMPFALCTARLQVFVFIAAALFVPWQAALVVMGLYVLSIASALLTAWLGQRAFKSMADYPVVVEMPIYRLPHWRMAMQTSWIEVRDFIKRASWLIIFGVMSLWALLHFPLGHGVGESYAADLSHWLAPIFAPMGLPDLYVLALLFGLVAKEVVLGGLMVLMNVSEGALSGAVVASISPEAAVAMMAFVLLYTPCLATLSVLKQEGGWRLMLTSLIWSLVFAWLVAVVIYQAAKLLLAW